MWITSSQQQAHPEEMRLHLPQSQPQVLNAPRVRMPVRTVQPGRNCCCRTRTGPRRGPVRPSRRSKLASNLTYCFLTLLRMGSSTFPGPSTGENQNHKTRSLSTCMHNHRRSRVCTAAPILALAKGGRSSSSLLLGQRRGGIHLGGRPRRCRRRGTAISHFPGNVSSGWLGLQSDPVLLRRKRWVSFKPTCTRSQPHCTCRPCFTGRPAWW